MGESKIGERREGEGRVLRRGETRERRRGEAGGRVDRKEREEEGESRQERRRKGERERRRDETGERNQDEREAKITTLSKHFFFLPALLRNERERETWQIPIHGPNLHYDLHNS